MKPFCQFQTALAHLHFVGKFSLRPAAWQQSQSVRCAMLECGNLQAFIIRQKRIPVKSQCALLSKTSSMGFFTIYPHVLVQICSSLLTHVGNPRSVIYSKHSSLESLEHVHHLMLLIASLDLRPSRPLRISGLTIEGVVHIRLVLVITARSRFRCVRIPKHTP